MIDLHLGDCLEVMKQIPDKSVDAIICDLPYGTTACKWDSVIPFEPLWDAYKRVIKDNGAIVLTAAQPFTSALVMSNVKMFKYSWVWDKKMPTGHLNAKHQPMRKTEDIVVFCKSKTVYNPQGLVYNPRLKTRNENTQGSNCYGKHGNSNISEYQNYPTNLLSIKNEFGLHPTQKPVVLMEYLVNTYTNESDTVLDNCMGSGTTGLACKNLNRKFIGIEQDATYYEIAKERINGSA